MTTTTIIGATLLILFGAAFELARLTGRRAARRQRDAGEIDAEQYDDAMNAWRDALR